MDLEDNVLKLVEMVSRMDGRLEQIPRLAERVSRLEQWMNYLKGAWSALAAACAVLFRLSWPK
jgi:hypothetical protein